MGIAGYRKFIYLETNPMRKLESCESRFLWKNGKLLAYYLEDLRVARPQVGNPWSKPYIRHMFRSCWAHARGVLGLVLFTCFVWWLVCHAVVHASIILLVIYRSRFSRMIPRIFFICWLACVSHTAITRCSTHPSRSFHALISSLWVVFFSEWAVVFS